jgi:cytochrome P450
METKEKARVVTAKKEEYQDYQTDPLRVLEYLVSKYGNEYDFVNLPFENGTNRYLILSAEYVEDVLQAKQKSFRKSPAFEFFKPVLGEGLLTSEGPKHTRDRRMIQPFFTTKKLSAYADTMISNTLELLNKWRENTAKERDISNDMMGLTLNIISETMFGTSIKKEQINRVDLASKTFSQLVSVGYRKTTDMGNIKEQLSHSVKDLQSVIEPIIKQKRAQIGEENVDLLSVLLQAKDEEKNMGMPDEEIYDQVVTIFFAGHETTSNALSYTWYLLSQNPHIEEKFHRELEEVLGGRTPTLEDHQKLAYTKAMLQESMRIFPPVHQIGRQAAEDVELGGFTFKKGDSFINSQYVLHRSEKYYQKPLEFIPERFEQGIPAGIPAFAYFPFGGGSRRCIGDHFAMMEAVLVLATIGQKYRLEKIEEVKPIPAITLMPGKLLMKIHER